MPTSGTYTYTITRDQIITLAYRKIARLGDYETLDAQRLAVGIETLNPVAKLLATKGMLIWKIETLIIPCSTFVAGATTIGIGSTVNSVRPLKIVSANRRDTLSNPDADVPMFVYSNEEYSVLSMKLQTGTPTSLYYQPLRNTGAVNLWPIPDTYWSANGSIVLRVSVPIQDFNAGTDEMDFPIEWAQALVDNLAYALAPIYGVPLGERQALKSDKTESTGEALSGDKEESSIFLQPHRRQ